MGRRDAVQVVVEVVARMRVLDPHLVVTYEPGWETRGNGTSANYEGGIWHHTATASSLARPFPTRNLLRDGRPDLRGPLCNFAGPFCTVEAPTIHVMAAHPANHAGASGGKSMGPLPKTGLFNPRVLGLEIDYAGLSAMSPGQLHVSRLWARAVADVVGDGDINRVRGHAETSVTGKWDPGYTNGKTYDLNALRRESAAITPTPHLEEDVPLTQQEINSISDAVWNRGLGRFGAAWQTVNAAADRAEAAAKSAAVASVDITPPAQASVSVDASAVAASLAVSGDFIAALAKAVNDDAARRMEQ